MFKLYTVSKSILTDTNGGHESLSNWSLPGPVAPFSVWSNQMVLT